LIEQRDDRSTSKSLSIEHIRLRRMAIWFGWVSICFQSRADVNLCVRQPTTIQDGRLATRSVAPQGETVRSAVRIW